MSIHDHPNLPMQSHTCRNSYMLQHNMQPELSRLNQELVRLNPELRLNTELSRLNPEMSRLNPELSRLNPEISRLNPEMSRLNPELSRLNPELSRLNPELARLNQELTHLAQMYSPDELARLQEIGHFDGHFNTLRGHLIPYRNCQRSLGTSAGNLHRDCRLEDNMTIECLHQKNGSKGINKT